MNDQDRPETPNFDRLAASAVPPVPPIKVSPPRPKYHQEEAVIGVELNNYTKRVPDEEGKYVLVTTHTERIERIKQPEEIEAEKQEEKARKRSDAIAATVVGGIVVGFLGLLGWIAYKEDQKVLNEQGDRIHRNNERLSEMLD